MKLRKVQVVAGVQEGLREVTLKRARVSRPPLMGAASAYGNCCSLLASSRVV